MHLYNLPILKVSQRIRNSVSAHLQPPNSPNQQAALLRGNLYYNCWIVSEDSLYMRKVDLATGRKSEKQVRIRKVKIMGVFLRGQWLVITLNQKDIGYISTQSIFENSKATSITLEKQNFACFYALQGLISFHSSCFKVLCIQDEVIAVYLSENSIVFNKIAQNASKPLKISVFDLGQSRNDQILNFQLNQQTLFNQNCQKQLVLVLLNITDKNGAKIYILIELLWKKFKYTFHQICTATSEEQNLEQNMRITTLSEFFILIYAGKCLVICKRWQEGVHIYGRMRIYTTVKDIIGVEKDSKGEQSIVMLCQKSNKKLVYSYNFRQLLSHMLLQPKLIHYDGNLQDQLIGFIRLPSQYLLLALTNQTYIMMPNILKLYRIISDVYESEQDDQYELLDQLFEDTYSSKEREFLPFSQFHIQLNKQKLQQQAMGQLLSSSKMNTKVLEFQNKLGKSIFCLKDDSSISLNALLREYTYIFIYLLKFLNHIKEKSTDENPKILINESFLFQECQTAFKNIYNQAPLVEEGKLVAIIHRKIINIKDNLLGILNLFTKSYRNQPHCSQTSQFYYFQILNQTSLPEICNFFTDQTSLIDFLAFFIYKAAIEDSQKLWKLGRQLLSKLLEIRQDYPPLFGLLCGNSMNYAISYHHLRTCKLLSEKQVAESRQQLQNLPSLNKTSVSGPSYLKKIGFLYLVSFVPEEYQAQKYDGNFVVLNIPKKYSEFTFSLLQNQTIQIRQKVYLMLTQQNIVKSIESMQNSIRIDFLAHSSCQIFILSQRLKIISEIFVQELVQCFIEKKNSRQNLKKQMNYNFKCFTNQEYQKQMKAKDFISLSYSNQKHEIDEHKQSKIIQKFYSSLLQICQNARLYKISQFLKTNIMKQQPSAVAVSQMQNLQISKIMPQQKHESNQKSDGKFQEVLFKNLWNLYQRIVHFSEVEKIEFEEELYHSGFSKSFIHILQQVSCSVELHSTHGIQKLIRTNQMQKFSLQGIRKAVLGKKKVSVNFKPIATLTHFQKSTLFNIARTELIKQCYLLTQQWIYRLEDLLMECALNEASLSFKNQAILAGLIELNKF